jgi:NADH-quinone oxidoreductase subunit H
VIETTLVQIVKAFAIFFIILQIIPPLTWVERRLMGRFQSRIGPNRVGPRGFLQPLADALKLISKEHSTPETAVPWMMTIAPLIAIATGIATLAVIPFGPFDACTPSSARCARRHSSSPTRWRSACPCWEWP